MSIKLGANIDSLQAQTELNDATASLTKSYQRLSSGMRINSASDDAAGLAIATQLNARSRIDTQAVRNVNDGVSVASIAEGALTALKNISQRQLELAEEAANGSYSSTQRQALNKEANALVDEYNRIVGSTKFNGLNLFDPSLSSVLIQAGVGQANALQLGLSGQLERPVGDGTFQAPVSYSTTGSGSLTNAVLADMNGDGKLDIVTANNNTPGRIEVLLNNGDGTFGAAKSYDFGLTNPVDVIVGDFNGDGKLDTVAYIGSGYIGELNGNGNGTLGGSTNDTRTLAAAPYEIESGDFNNDGTLDLIVTSQNKKAYVLIGNGNGTFKSAVTQFQVGTSNNNRVSVGDVNGDGNADLVLIGTTTGTVNVMLGNGNGTFAAAASFQSGNVSGSDGVTLGDVNGDGILDVISSGYGYSTGQVSILIGNGNGTFKAASTYVAPEADTPIVAADLNGDGTLDIVTGADVLLGNEDGTFSAARSFNVFGQSVAIGDVTGDGRPDIVAGIYNNTVDILAANAAFTSNSTHLNILTQANARDALTTINANLDRIEGQLGTIGAITNRFQVAINNLQTQNENFEAAASRIQDVDVAAETANLTRTQILQQAAASVLAQANQEPALALKLLT